MNDIIAIPAVEQINLEHRLANSKAGEAVQHATNCGLMLLQIKASLNHGEWLPWLNGEIAAGRLEVKHSQAHSYMRLASNLQRAGNLEGATSIRAALELLSDKEPEAEAQGTLIGVEAERQAREAAEAKAETERQYRELFERRAQEIQTESNERRKKIRELETQIDLLKAQPAPKPEKVIVAPDDYETAKGKVAQLETELASLKKEQAKLISNQVKAKLHERQDELDVMERRKTLLEEQVARMTAYMASLDSEADRIEVHRSVIEKSRLSLIDLAAFLGDSDPISDAETLKRWRALAAMLGDAIAAIHHFAGGASPALAVIRAAD